MARRSVSKIADLVIPNGAAVSNIFQADETYEDADRVMMTRESAVDGALTFTLEVTDDPEPSTSSTWSTYQILNGAALANFALPTVANIAFQVPEGALAATGWRIRASGNVTATRTFGVSKQFVNN